MSTFTIELRTGIGTPDNKIHAWLHIGRPDGSEEAWGLYPKTDSVGNMISDYHRTSASLKRRLDLFYRLAFCHPNRHRP